ncbi:unnamed protein product [Heterobilharzia americana]|nr:unnamed protein product [Heterobilharzia americana]
MEWKSTLPTFNCRVNNLFQYCHTDDNHQHTEFSSGYHDVANSTEGSLCHAVGTNLLQHPNHDRKVQLKRKESHNHTMLRYTPTNNADQEKKEEFHRQLQSAIEKNLLQMVTSKF